MQALVACNSQSCSAVSSKDQIKVLTIFLLQDTRQEG
jgi:hypothetical protein